MHELKIDKDFMSLSVFPAEDELVELEQSLLQEGCKQPIKVWQGFIYDGHKRYSICRAKKIDFDITEVDFPTKNEAVAALCRERLKTVKNQTPLQKHLIGKLYRTIAESNKVSRTDLKNDTTKAVADELGINFITVLRYGLYSSGMDRIFGYDPALFIAILKGEVFINRDEMIEMVKYPEETFKRICRKYMKHDEVRMRAHTPHGKRPQLQSSETDPLSVSVKEMPVIDPDRDIRGLTLTIPMWISSISRAMEHTDTDKATNTAKAQLSDALIKLIVQINIALEELQ